MASLTINNGGTVYTPRGAVLNFSPFGGGTGLALYGTSITGGFQITNAYTAVVAGAGTATATIGGYFNIATSPGVFNVTNNSLASGIDLDMAASLAGVGFYKIGSGTMRLGGTTLSQQNTLSGNVYVYGGTLILNKQIQAVADVALPIGASTVQVGDAVTPATVLLGADEQISKTAPVVVTSSGTFNLAGHNQTIAGLTIGGLGTGGILPGGSVISVDPVSQAQLSSTLYITTLNMNGGTINLGPSGRLIVTSGANPAVTVTGNGTSTGSTIASPIYLANGTSDGTNLVSVWAVNPLYGQPTGLPDLTISGPITGPYGFYKDGVGTLLITSTNNTYTLDSTVNNGRLLAGAANILPQSALLRMDNNAAGALFDMAGYNQAIGSVNGGGTTGGWINLGSRSGTGGQLTFGYDNTDQAFAGLIYGGTAGQYSLIKVGNGMQDLTGPNQFGFLGDTHVASGAASPHYRELQPAVHDQRDDRPARNSPSIT